MWSNKNLKQLESRETELFTHVSCGQLNNVMIKYLYFKPVSYRRTLYPITPRPVLVYFAPRPILDHCASSLYKLFHGSIPLGILFRCGGP